MRQCISSTFYKSISHANLRYAQMMINDPYFDSETFMKHSKVMGLLSRWILGIMHIVDNSQKIEPMKMHYF